jgi:hypothetical protein
MQISEDEGDARNGSPYTLLSAVLSTWPIWEMVDALARVAYFTLCKCVTEQWSIFLTKHSSYSLLHLII